MKKKRFLTTLAAAALAASMLSALPASAANYPEAKWATGGTKNYTKYLLLDKKANVPNATFSYTVTPGEPVNYAGTNNVAVYAGIVPEGGITASVAFSSDSNTQDNTGDEAITTDTTKKYATGTISLNFSGVQFKEPGIYRYVLTEDDAEEGELGAGISCVGDYEKTLDVYVMDTNGTLAVQDYVLYTTDPDDDDTIEKSDGFINEYSSQSLSFAKRVTGNQGSKDKYFKFTVTITNASGATLNINGDKSNFETTTRANSATATTYTTAVMNAANTVDQSTADGQQLVIASDSASYDFYLQDGQYITLDGLPKGAGYVVTEANEEYTSTVTEDADGKKFTYNSIEFKDAASGTIGTADVATGFTNNKDGSIPTGVILSIAGPAVVGLAVIGGLIFMIIKRKKEDSED